MIDPRKTHNETVKRWLHLITSGRAHPELANGSQERLWEQIANDALQRTKVQIRSGKGQALAGAGQNTTGLVYGTFVRYLKAPQFMITRQEDAAAELEKQATNKHFQAAQTIAGVLADAWDRHGLLRRKDFLQHIQGTSRRFGQMQRTMNELSAEEVDLLDRGRRSEDTQDDLTAINRILTAEGMEQIGFLKEGPEGPRLGA